MDLDYRFWNHYTIDGATLGWSKIAWHSSLLWYPAESWTTAPMVPEEIRAATMLEF